MSLQIKYIQCYLDSGLKVRHSALLYDSKGNSYWGYKVMEVLSLNTQTGWINDNPYYHLDKVKPILRPMSSLYTPLEDGSIPIVELAKMATDMMVFVDEIIFDQDDDRSVYCKVSGHDNNDKVVVFGFNNGEFWLAEKHTGKFINNLTLHNYLSQHHYDVNDLIGKGYAVSINDVKEEV